MPDSSKTQILHFATLAAPVKIANKNAAVVICANFARRLGSHILIGGMASDRFTISVIDKVTGAPLPASLFFGDCDAQAGDKVYKRPYDPLYTVVCMDESPRQLIRNTREPLPVKPGCAERVDYEYERCGVCNIFMAVKPLVGKRLVTVTPVDITGRIKADTWEILPKRWIVERTFAWFNNSRRLSKDYEIATTSAEAFVKISHIRTLLNRS